MNTWQSATWLCSTGCYIFESYLRLSHKVSKWPSREQDPGLCKPQVWILCTFSYSPPMAGSSSVLLDAVSAPWDHVVSAFLGHLVLWILGMPSQYPAMNYLDCGSASRLLGIFVSRLRIRPLKPLACVVLSGCAGSDGQTVSLFPAGLRLSLAFSKAVSLVQISCLRLKKKEQQQQTTECLSWLKLLWVRS